MNYFKGFFISLLLHVAVVASFLMLTTRVVHLQGDRVIIDLSALMVEDKEEAEIPELEPLAPTPPEPVPEVEPEAVPPPPRPPAPPPPEPTPIPPTPIVAPVQEAAPTERYVEADENSVAPEDGYNMNPPAVTSSNNLDEYDENSNFVFSAPVIDENANIRRSYVTGNYNYILRRIRNSLIYPQQARRSGITGIVSVMFTINADGSATNIVVESSSGSPFLDEAAVTAVAKASPFPKPPLAAQIVVPIDFKLR